MNKLSENKYDNLVEKIGLLIVKKQEKAFASVNTILLETYWKIGKYIVEFEQKGENKAKYGLKLLKNISSDLKHKYGKGFSKSNLYLMRIFYIRFPKFQTLSGKLSWSHYAELLSVSNELAFSFYLKQCEIEKWSVRELKRQLQKEIEYLLQRK